MNRVFACLFRGKGLPKFCNDAYGTRDVEHLAAGIQRHITDGHLTVLADDTYLGPLEAKGFDVIPFEGHGCGGWTSILEVCRPSLRQEERCMWVGLDTVFVGPSDWLFEWDRHPVGIPRDPYHPSVPCNAVWTWNAEGADIVWKAFEEYRTKNSMADFKLFGSPSEMVLLRHLFRKHGWEWFEPRPRKLLSYKCHVRKGARWRYASVVYFHGHPKLWDLPKRDPIRQVWEGK